MQDVDNDENRLIHSIDELERQKKLNTLLMQHKFVEEVKQSL